MVLPAMSMPIDVLDPAMVLPMRKARFADIRTGFRPKTLEAPAHNGVVEVLAKVYELPTQVYCAADASK